MRKRLETLFSVFVGIAFLAAYLVVSTMDYYTYMLR